MIRRNLIPLVALMAVCARSWAAPVDIGLATRAAEFRLSRDCSGCTLGGAFRDVVSSDGGTLLARAFDLEPAGYVVVSADDALPPVVAYSYEGELDGPAGSFGILDLARLDLGQRLLLQPEWMAEANRSSWIDLGAEGPMPVEPLEQWPPAGSTPTGGWLWENWTQSSPYNAYCPLDLTTGNRSVAGCPAVAMGMILDNLETSNSTRFDDSDDYWHNYNEYYWIDDDHVAHDFPSWPELNVLLDTLDAHYEAGTALTNSDKAAVVAASGYACKQVFTSSVSGTFGVDQAYDAYVRFGFTECELLVESSDSLFEKLSQNLMDARCSHLAIVDAGWNYGHNVVIDGYNTDQYYHINFGWGGSYNGWYQFPLSGMPYQMNVIEGVIVNIGTELTGFGDGSAPAGPTLAVLGNPVSAQASLELTLPGAGHVTVRVYDCTGRILSTLTEGLLPSGVHELSWSTAGVPSGIYIVRAATPAGSAAASLVVVRGADLR